MLMSPYRSRREGSIAPLLAFFSVALFSCVALAIDLGMIIVARTQCQNAADAAALAGTRMLDNKPTSVNNSRDSAESEAKAQAASNQYLNQYFSKNDVTELSIGLYRYDTSAQRFFSDFVNPKIDGESWTAMKVSVRGNQQAYFSKLFGLTSLNTGATAVAVHRPRDIAFAIDFTGSMKFGTTGNWGTDVTNPTEGGSLNADPIYPTFGHYQRYTGYSTDPNTDPTAAAPGDRPNPLYVNQGFVKSSGELLAPANFTYTTQGGPPCVDDFYTDTSNSGSPTTAAYPVNPANLTKAFVNAVMPTPDTYADQSGATYDGDRWPRKGGQRYTASTTWDPTTATGAARNTMELLGWAALPVRQNTTGWGPYNVNAAAANYAANGSNFRDATWERYGYDLDIAHYIANRGTNWDPRWDWNLDVATPRWEHERAAPSAWVNVDPTHTFRPQRRTTELFKGYSMGPRYYGKTFFIWPPDPRAPVGTNPAAGGYVPGDWRLRFFMNRSGGSYNPQSDNDSTTAGPQNVNQELVRGTVGPTLTAPSGNYGINYNNILAWLKSGPQTLPPNLRAGKVVYYTSIPDTITVTGSDSTEVALDKAFWKNYIEYVLAAAISDATYDDYDMLAGHEKKVWPEGATQTITATTAYNRTGTATDAREIDPLPSMNYFDNPLRPREHFWFGPLTMMKFLFEAKANWWSGTIHESQCWQLKVALSSVLDDVRNNHPNDFAGLAFFSHSTAYYRTIRSPMSQSWTTAKNALFYPFNLNATASPTSTDEVRPYNTSFGSIGSLVNANIPNANGGTDPNSGFALAYNLLSSSPNVNTDPVKRGRRGAAKVVIFETDGVPNAHQSWQFNANGYDSYYSNTGNGGSDGNGSINAMQPAYDIVTQIRKPAATSNGGGVDSGFSTGSSPARVYAIGFGDLFSTPTATQQNNARAFLLQIQKLGGTSASTATALPADQIITGDYATRIENMRAVLERIIQAGVQVTLIE